MTVVTHVSIRGRVQGVSYRAWVADEAHGRGLEGWVRNRRDGSVEAVFSGPAATVASMLAACRQGPPLARVEAVEEVPLQDALSLRRPDERFSILDTI